MLQKTMICKEKVFVESNAHWTQGIMMIQTVSIKLRNFLNVRVDMQAVWRTEEERSREQNTFWRNRT